MPKIIADAKEKILTCTRTQLFETGYSSLSLRQIAKECHLGVGTIYNYFPSKDDLIATIMLEDWINCLHQMDTHIQSASNIEQGLMSIYQSLHDYCCIYQNLFKEASSSAYAISSRHDLLITQMKERIDSLMIRFEKDNDLGIILAELMLTCATKNTITDNQLKKAIHLLTRKENNYEQF